MLTAKELLRSLRTRCRLFLRPGTNITRGKSASRKIALTFDGHFGGDSIFNPEAAERILSILEHRCVKCTFFLTGTFIETHPALTGKMVDSGHEVGNHTFTHPHLYSIGEQAFERELIRTEQAFFRATGKRISPYWRAPYGEYHRRLWHISARRGYTHIAWTCGRTREQNFDSLDWVEDPQSDRYYSPEQIRDHILSSRYKNGAIVLFHLGARKTDPVHRQLPALIEGLISKQYRIVTITELLRGNARPVKG